MNKSSNLVWVDLEMTGLNPEKDKILEIATLITDKNLNVIEEGPCLAIGYPQIPEMDELVHKIHFNSGLIDRVKNSSVSLSQAENITFDFISKHVKKGESPLCGNSIWQDKQFLQKYMPNIINYLHYRIIDVSTLKELVKIWYPNNPESNFEKKKLHQALDDIRESIAELKHYKKHFFV